MYSAEMMCIHDYKRVDKRVARRLFNEGEAIFLVPCNCDVHSLFTYEIGKDYWGIDEDPDFDKVVNAFEWYNCNSELGRYTMFFIKKGE